MKVSRKRKGGAFADSVMVLKRVPLKEHAIKRLLLIAWSEIQLTGPSACVRSTSVNLTSFRNFISNLAPISRDTVARS